MRKMFPLAAAIFLLGGTFGDKIANFRLNNLENKIVSYSEIKGKKITVIDFWATWCKPCTRSIPKLVAIYKRYEKQGVQIIGINVDGTRNLPKVKPMAHALGIVYPVLLDINGQIMAKLKVTAMPSILIVNANDEIVSFHQGYRPGDENILEDAIKKLLEKGQEEMDNK
jgi:thiol-disulfide isomerase/thioredoxin